MGTATGRGTTTRSTSGAIPRRSGSARPRRSITFVRTVASVVLAASPPARRARPCWSSRSVVYWVGDMPRRLRRPGRDCETRIGAVLDILCDRFCAAAFYIGLAWLQPDLSPAIFVYLAEFMVVDCFLSLAFLAWPIRSPNYFYVVDRPLWLWNWSKPGKAVNSSLFAVLLLVTGWVWVGAVIATGAAGDEDASRWSGWHGSACRSRTVGFPACRCTPRRHGCRRKPLGSGSTPTSSAAASCCSSSILMVGCSPSAAGATTPERPCAADDDA